VLKNFKLNKKELLNEIDSITTTYQGAIWDIIGNIILTIRRFMNRNMLKALWTDKKNRPLLPFR